MPRIWIITNGRRGDVVHCQAIASRLNQDIREIVVAPRAPHAWLMPWGGIDPREYELISPPYPDLIIASSRRSVPYVRHVVKNSKGMTKALFMKYPGCDVSRFAWSWHPSHDRKPGPTIIESLVAPHLVTPEVLKSHRDASDPRLSHLPGPRLGIILGGNTRRVTYDQAVMDAFCKNLGSLESFGSVLISGSRRTPPAFLDTLEKNISKPSFIWDGADDNPYFDILALSDALVVTGDSHNLVSEALAAGRKTYVFNPPGNAPKFNWTLRELEKQGLINTRFDAITPDLQPPFDETENTAKAIKEAFHL